MFTSTFSTVVIIILLQIYWDKLHLLLIKLYLPSFSSSVNSNVNFVSTDGVMVQVTAEVMKEFKQAIKDMKEFSIATSQQAAGGSEEFNSKIGIEWSTADVMDRPR